MTTPAPFDVHTHVVPPVTPFLARLADKDPRWARLVERPGRTDVADVYVSGRVFRTVRRVAYDLDARRAELSADAVAGQLLSAMPELFAVWAPPADAVAYCRAFNEWLAAALPAKDGFFHGLGVVPVQDPDAAAAMLGEVHALGLLGVEIPSGTPEAALHEDRFAGFFAEAERLGLLVFVHAVGAAHSFAHPIAGTSAIFPSRIGESIAGLIANGVLARHPGLRLLASHGGGGLPSALARLDYVRDVTPELSEYLPESATVYAGRLWYDQLLFAPRLLRLLVETVGTERIVLGSDYPFLRGDPAAVLDDPGLPAGLRTDVTSTNPARLIALLSHREAVPGGMS